MRTDCTNRFDVQLETLRKMYANELPWNEMGDRHGRRRLATHLSLMVMLHMRNILPFEDLNRILSILARPLLAQVEPGNQNEGGNEQENMENIFNDLNIDGDGGSNARVSGITVEALYSEILAKFIFNLGHFNLVENNEVYNPIDIFIVIIMLYNLNVIFIVIIIYPNNSRDVYLYIYSVSAYMG